MRWFPDGSYELEPAEKVAKAGFDEMSEWGHADALAWARVALFEHYGENPPAIDVGFWEWLVWSDAVGPVVEAPAVERDGEIVWIPDLTQVNPWG